MRFIEYMPFGKWKGEKVIRTPEILSEIERQHGKMVPVLTTESSTSRRYRLVDSGIEFGIIPTMSGTMCRSCDRFRVDSQGVIRNS